MGGEVHTAASAEAIAESYAASECVGTVGDVVDVRDEDGVWVVELKTHTISKAYTHRIEITRSVGNVVAHERELTPAK